jgi:hypothetical protein
VRYVNTALVATYWLIGRRIVEYEQKGKERAEYGASLLKRLSADLTPRFGKGFTERNLEHMRQFYLVYPQISHTVGAKLSDNTDEKPHTAGAKLEPTFPTVPEISETLIRKFPLSWSHYRLLMRLDEPFKREFYEVECIRGNWSVRQLDRQIQSMLLAMPMQGR